jgi:DNA-binding response OmpR family regulator
MNDPTACALEYGLRRVFRSGPLVLDCDRFAAYVDGRPVALTRLEFDLLAYLARHLHRVIPPAEILERVVRGSSQEPAAIVRVHVCHLRRKLGAASTLLQTVRGRGVMLVGEADLPALTFSQR